MATEMQCLSSAVVCTGEPCIDGCARFSLPLAYSSVDSTSGDILPNLGAEGAAVCDAPRDVCCLLSVHVTHLILAVKSKQITT